MHEHIAIPHYSKAIWTFTYRGLKIEITTDIHHEEKIYSAWVIHATGSAVAVPRAQTKKIAIIRAKQWIEAHF